MENGEVVFGGPDREPRLLRNLLERCVDAVPSGGSICWMTYYFRDEQLAKALIRAKSRGVDVKLCVEGAPRQKQANEGVIRLLSGPGGIGPGLKVVRHGLPGHLHSKLYCFSHPRPFVLAGSFNPSGNVPEYDPALIADIGDQDRGHNLLVAITEPELVGACRSRVAAVHSGRSPYGRLASRSSSFAVAGGYEAYFFPQLGRNPLDERLARLGPGSTLRIVASHVSERATADLLTRLARRGVGVEVLTHHTLRRAPEKVAERLRSGGVRVYRYEHPQALPMHSKFMLAGDGEQRWSAFGSYNLKRRSRWLNQELLIFSSDSELWRRLDERWSEMIAEPWCRA